MSFRHPFITDFIYQGGEHVKDANPKLTKVFNEHTTLCNPVDDMLIIPESCDGDCYAQAHFSGPVWQFYAQQAVINEDPINYLYRAVLPNGE